MSSLSHCPPSAFDVWHDRAVFHFLTDEEDRKRYVKQVERSVKPGGHVLIATFAPDGPVKCSGLDVVRYSPEGLLAELGASFRLVRALNEDHATPMATVQRFVYCVFQRR